MIDTNDFVGVWALEEWSVTHKPSGYVVYPFDGNSEGHIIYTENGWVSATLMETDRPPVPQDRRHLFAARMQLAPPAGIQAPELTAEKQQKFDRLKELFCRSGMGYVAYCGPFTVNGDMVQHHIKNSLIPQWTGTVLERKYEFDGDLLTLSATDGDFADKLVWKRTA
ncbi:MULTISPECIES: lipocalin-like domain-containing protein [unclassified Endozoicomonas]|uniref:lipocalin-like domain-containing protein n=1 Tax=unclassified Endozoicomonas TaxID=2644528 RepID=UPI003BB68067